MQDPQRNTPFNPGRRDLLAGISAVLAGGAVPAWGQSGSYPNRPVNVIVPFGTGGAVQALTERMGPDLNREMGQPMINDYKGGAGGMLGGEIAARAQPNGYTLLLATPSALAASPAVYKNPKYNPVTDFIPVSMVATTTFVLVVNSNLPIHNVRDLIAYGKANPGKLNFASAGVGSMDHVGGEVLQRLAGFKMTHIPYKGPGASLQDLVAGRLDALISSPIPVKPHVESGKIRAIAVTSNKRSPAMKDVATIAEAGFPDYDMTSWYAYVAPTGTPREVVAKVDAAVKKALANPNTVSFMEGFGLAPATATPEEFGQILAQDIRRWKDWVKQTGIQAE